MEDKLNGLEKWFLALAASIILASGGAQVITLTTLAEVRADLRNIKESSKDRYTGSQALSQIKLQELRDAQQDDRIGRALEMLHSRTDRFSAIESRLNNLEKEQ